MAGADVAYRHLPFFYSDLFDLGYEAVGRARRTSRGVADWREPYRRGIVYYVVGRPSPRRPRVGRLRQDGRSTALIADPGPHGAGNVRGRISV